MAVSFPNAQLNSAEAIQLWSQDHSDWAKEQMVLANMGLIQMCMKRMNIRIDDEELFDVGVLALCKAVNTFDPSKGYQFSTYAAHLIHNEICMYFYYQKKCVQPIVSLDVPISMEEKQAPSFDADLTYKDLLKDPRSVEDAVTTKMLLEWMQKNLKQREWDMVKLRLSGKTHQEIAQKYGISRAMVSRIFQIIQKKVRRAGWERL